MAEFGIEVTYKDGTSTYRSLGTELTDWNVDICDSRTLANLTLLIPESLVIQVWYDNGDFLCVNGCNCWRDNCKAEQTALLQTSSPDRDTDQCSSGCTLEVVERTSNDINTVADESLLNWQKTVPVHQNWEFGIGIQLCPNGSIPEPTNVSIFSIRHNFIKLVDVEVVVYPEQQCQNYIQISVQDGTDNVIVTTQHGISADSYNQIRVNQVHQGVN